MGWGEGYSTPNTQHPTSDVQLRRLVSFSRGSCSNIPEGVIHTFF